MLLFQQQKYLLKNYTLYFQPVSIDMLRCVKTCVGLRETSVNEKWPLPGGSQATDSHVHTDRRSLMHVKGQFSKAFAHIYPKKL